jgi:hypothetical protein
VARLVEGQVHEVEERVHEVRSRDPVAQKAEGPEGEKHEEEAAGGEAQRARRSGQMEESLLEVLRHGAQMLPSEAATGLA